MEVEGGTCDLPLATSHPNPATADLWLQTPHSFLPRGLQVASAEACHWLQAIVWVVQERWVWEVNVKG